MEPETSATQAEQNFLDKRRLQLMTIGFSTGSTLFAIGGLLGIINRGPINPTFAAGSVFFTAAAVIQWRTAVAHDPDAKRLRKRAETNLANPDWVAAVLQLLGTLFFNAMTFRAVVVPSVSPDYRSAVWIPDKYGSILFLVSSAVALHPLSSARRHRLVKGRSVPIVWGNMAGSIFFAVSAIGAQAVAPGELKNLVWCFWGTLLGGVCFLFASVLLWPGQNSEP